MVRYVTVSRAAELTGFTEEAIRANMERGVWPTPALWVKAPNNRILIDLEGYHAWVEGRVCAQLVSKQSKSTSAGKANVAGNVYAFDPRVPTSNTARAGKGE